MILFYSKRLQLFPPFLFFLETIFLSFFYLGTTDAVSLVRRTGGKGRWGGADLMGTFDSQPLYPVLSILFFFSFPFAGGPFPPSFSLSFSLSLSLSPFLPNTAF